MGQRAAIYARVSTSDQCCERQLAELSAFAARADYEVVGTFAETGSGAKLDRAMRRQVMALAQARRIDAVLVTELSRWGRSTVDLLNTLRELESWKVSVISMSGLAFDLSSPHGRMMATLLSGIAEFESDLISERVKSGLAAARARGKKLGRQKGNRPKSDRLAPRVMKLVSEGRSYRWIARDLAISKNTVADIVKRGRTPSQDPRPVRKACPIVLRETDHGMEFLAFEHPLAGKQLVKGTIENGETDVAAAERELVEESGLKTSNDFVRVGASYEICPNQEWVFFQITLTDAPDSWLFWTEDDGGHQFRFFWHRLDDKLTGRWHQSFAKALSFFKQHAKLP